MSNLLPLLLLAILAGSTVSGFAASIHGKVEGPAGPLAGAKLTLLQNGSELQTTDSNPAGEYSFDNLSAGTYQLQVVSAPFVPIVKEIVLSDADRGEEAAITMGALNESVTVSAGRIPVPVAASTSDVKIMSGDDLKQMPYQSLDDRLRTFPEFSLFRRSSSLVAQPTTQGVSLRGIGPSGVSRSLVLLSGVPLNDAFGGWVYWDRVPILAIQQVEVANGGQSSLYGNYGLGGVVQLLKKTPESATFEFQGQGGSNNSRNFEFLASHRLGPWGVSSSGSFFAFDGYPVVAASQRGTADIRAFSRHQAMRFSVDRAPVHHSLVWSLDAGFLNEDRGNGTPLTPNQTRSFDFSTGFQWTAGPGHQLEGRSFFRHTIFDSNYSAVAADRNSERLTVQQSVPSVDGGAALEWFLTRGRSRISTGADFWMVSGASTDNAIVNSRISLVRLGGGRQVTAGLFAEENYALSPKATLVLGGRLDMWKNYNGRLGSFLPGAPKIVASVPEITRGVFSPSAGFSYDATSKLSLHGSVYRSFRAPTLNELYRGFTVGNVITNPNSGLVPEHSVGGEFGGRFRLTEHLRADLAGFVNRLEQPVSNVTQQITATQIIRQRRNLGNARIYGVQGSLAWQPSAKMKFAAFYLWDRASVTDFAADKTLIGKRLPEVPEHRATFTADVSIPHGFGVSLVGRLVAHQFDDDLNAIVLNRYFQLDAQLSRGLGESARVFISLENLTDAKILTTRILSPRPVDFVGTPFAVRGGIYIRLHKGSGF